MKNAIFLLISFIFVSCFGQQKKTISIKPDTEIVQVSINQLAWIEGYWQGEAFGGIVEEIWSAPRGGSMMFVFRHIADNKVTFYETGAIMETPKGLILKLKHFHGDLKGWEKKEETVDFKFIKLENNTAYFNNFTFEKINANEMNMYVMVTNKDGTENEVKFNYKRKL